jgi:hypothetical protein
MHEFRVRQTKVLSCRGSLLRRVFPCCNNTRCDLSAGNCATVLCGLAGKKLTCLVPLMSSQILSTLHMTSCHKKCEERQSQRTLVEIFSLSLLCLFQSQEKLSPPSCAAWASCTGTRMCPRCRGWSRCLRGGSSFFFSYDWPRCEALVF